MSFLINFWKMLYILRGKRPDELLKEKRLSHRITCTIHGTYSYMEHHALPLVIRDIGLYGMQICIEKRLKPGHCVLVTAKSGNALLQNSSYTAKDIFMTVLWCRKGRKNYLAGLRYNDSQKNLHNSWIASVLDRFGMSRGEDNFKRKSMRLSSNLAITCRFLTGDAPIHGKVIDIGLEGILIATDKKIKPEAGLRCRMGPYKSLNSMVFDGKIIHNRFDSDQDKWLTGVVYRGLDEYQTRLLNEYITTLYIENKMTIAH